ncbi:uncharacterized protein LOC142772252 [Rhipicephalus microplus]|uniref:uncharacterized protein LOC142772252 n=1 Tax=Rhipicephalus microplus TaxID=6941 RepID=UPI003F6AE222
MAPTTAAYPPGINTGHQHDPPTFVSLGGEDVEKRFLGALTTEQVTADGLTALKYVQSFQSERTVHLVGKVVLPDFVQRTLGLGPKFAFVKKRDPPDLLAIVRSVSSQVPQEDSSRCISEGLDILQRDKEGGFAVLTKRQYFEKAQSAISTVFDTFTGIDLRKVKLSLDIFFTAKTHKIDCPLRVIVSENGTWQKQVALFLQEQLNLLTIDDPFLVKDSEAVIKFLRSNDKGLKTFSIDVKDLYYSLPHNGVLQCLEGCIYSFGSINFQNASGMPVHGFQELLSFYLKSMVASWNEQHLIKKSGICIGSCLAPVLSDIFLAHKDRHIQKDLDLSLVVKVCRFVDDFIVFIDCLDTVFGVVVLSLVDLFKKHLYPLELTHELPYGNSIRFLDLTLCPRSNHLCCLYNKEAQSRKNVAAGTTSPSGALTSRICHCSTVAFQSQADFVRPPALLLASVARGTCIDDPETTLDKGEIRGCISTHRVPSPGREVLIGYQCQIFLRCREPYVSTLLRIGELGVYVRKPTLLRKRSYESRGNKPVLPFTSAHSKLVKRAVVKSCFQNSLMKSCHHKLDESLWAQAKRLLNSGYPLHLLTAVAECISRKGRANGKDQVVFSAPEKLQGMCKKVNAESSGKQVCKIKQREKFVNCCWGVVYSTPLTCGCEYIGQSGRCVNERLKEHKYVERAVRGHLALHCQRCGCVHICSKTPVYSLRPVTEPHVK